MDQKPIEVEQGWEQMQKGITKLKNILQGFPEKPFASEEEYTMLYTTIYNMFPPQKTPYEYSHQQLYEKYKHNFDEYNKSTVFPSIRDNHHEFLLRELVRRWNNHKVMSKWLERAPLSTTGFACFRDLAFNKVKDEAVDTMISLIHKEREGEQIDSSLLKNVVNIYVEIGMGDMNHYEKDFEVHMLGDSSAYHARKATGWINIESFPD